MLSLLRGRIGGKGEQKADEAKVARDNFLSLTSPDGKCQFLKEFIENGKGKQPGSLAFARR
eukprot:2749953-Karenia_brevis.AAC.1